MICKKCGNQLGPNDKFCMKCGTLNEQQAEANSNPADSEVTQTQDITPQQNETQNSSQELNSNLNQTPNMSFNSNLDINPNLNHTPNMNLNSNPNSNPNMNPNFNPNMNANPNYAPNPNFNQNPNYNPNPNFNQGGWGMMPYQNAPAVKKGGGALPKVIILILTAIAGFLIYGMFFFPIFERQSSGIFTYSEIKMSLYDITDRSYFIYLEEEIANMVLWSAIGIAAVLGLLLLIAIINCIFSKHKSAYTLLFITFIIITLILIGLLVCAYAWKEELTYSSATVAPVYIGLAIGSLVLTILTPILRAKCS